MNLLYRFRLPLKLSILAGILIYLLYESFTHNVGAGIACIFWAALCIAEYALFRQESIHLRSALDVLRELRNGNMDARLKTADISGNQLALANHINDVCDIVDVMNRESLLSMTAISKGKLYRKIMLKGLNGKFRESSQSINKTIEDFYGRTKSLHTETVKFESTIKSLVETVLESLEHLISDFQALLKSSQTTKEKSTDVLTETRRAEEMITSLNQAGSELALAINEVSTQVHESNLSTLSATTSIQEASEKIYKLKDVSQEINNVIALITEIAEQTNLLALNATIEATRAGEYGKSFAVVAAEVKNLANKTVESSDKIVNQVKLTHAYVDTTVESIDNVFKRLNQLSQLSSAIAAAVEQQNATTKQISHNMLEGMQNIQNVNVTVKDVSQIAAETFDSSTEMQNNLSDLQLKVQNIRDTIQTFSKFVQDPSLQPAE